MLQQAPPAVAIACGVCTALAVYLLVLVSSAWFDRTGRREGLVHRGTDAVIACVRALEAPEADRAGLLQEVDALYRVGRLPPGVDLEGVEPVTLTRQRLRETAPRVGRASA